MAQPRNIDELVRSVSANRHTTRITIIPTPFSKNSVDATFSSGAQALRTAYDSLPWLHAGGPQEDLAHPITVSAVTDYFLARQSRTTNYNILLAAINAATRTARR